MYLSAARDLSIVAARIRPRTESGMPLQFFDFVRTALPAFRKVYSAKDWKAEDQLLDNLVQEMVERYHLPADRPAQLRSWKKLLFTELIWQDFVQPSFLNRGSIYSSLYSRIWTPPAVTPSTLVAIGHSPKADRAGAAQLLSAVKREYLIEALPQFRWAKAQGPHHAQAFLEALLRVLPLLVEPCAQDLEKRKLSAYVWYLEERRRIRAVLRWLDRDIDVAMQWSPLTHYVEIDEEEGSYK